MTSAQWNDDKFTKMLKEEAQNIRFITDKELKKVEDYLHKTTELSELYTSFDSKKKNSSTK